MLPTHPQRLWQLCGCLCLWLVSMGCTSLTTTDSKSGGKPWPWSKPEPEPTLPARILTIWTDAVHHQSGQKAQRGFGGRVVFYEEAKNDPIQVDGQLTIYVFPDEAGTDGAVPERKYVFGADELQRHYSKSSLGDSYSVWLPWDAVGGPSRQLTLIARFDARNGGTVMSEPAKKMLPGVSRRTDPNAALTSTDPRSARTTTEDFDRSEEPRGSTPLDSQPATTQSPESRSAQESSRPASAQNTAPQPMRTLPPAAVTPAPRSIADFLRQDAPAADAEVAHEMNERGQASSIQPVGYWSPADEQRGTNASAVATGGPANDSRVETIDLGQLRSNQTGAIAIPQHLLQNLPPVPATSDEPRNPEQVERSDNATIFYGRPNNLAASNNGLPNSTLANSVREDHQSTSETSTEWPRQSRTLGSNRRSIADQRQQQIRQIPDNRPTRHAPLQSD